MAGFSVRMTRLLRWSQIQLRFNLFSANKNKVIAFSVLNTLKVVIRSFLAFLSVLSSPGLFPFSPFPSSHSPPPPIQLLSFFLKLQFIECQREPQLQPTHVVDGENEAQGVRETSDKD